LKMRKSLVIAAITISCITFIIAFASLLVAILYDPNRSPSLTEGSPGDVLTLDANTQPSWEENRVPTGGNAGDSLTLDSNGNTEWTPPPAPYVLPEDITTAASQVFRYMDTVPSGTSANAVPIKIVSNQLTSIKVWFAIPPSAAQVILLRVYRYRKINGVFQYTQLNDTITINSSLDWSTIHDFSGEIRDIDIDMDTDMLAISTVNTLGGDPNSIRALTVTVETGVTNSTKVVIPVVPETQVWPPQ